MKFKLEENLGERGRAVLQAAGHDVSTVSMQRLGGASDEESIDICCSEERCLVTLDLDFASPLRFSPERYADRPSYDDLLGLVRELVIGVSARRKAMDR